MKSKKSKTNDESSPPDSVSAITKSDRDFHQSFVKGLIEVERYKQREEDLVAAQIGEIG